MARGVRTIRVRFDGDTAGLVAAAKSAGVVVEDFGDKTGKDFIRGMDRNVNRNIASRFASMAGRALTGFGIALQGGALRDPRIAGALGGAVLAAITVGMPVLGSLAAGLFVGAFGTGLAVIPAIFAAKTAPVKRSFRALARDVGAALRDMSAPFQQTLLQISDTARSVFGSFAPHLRRAFADMAPALSLFSLQFGDAFRELSRTIEPVADAFVRLLGALGPEMPGIMKGLADGIIAVADSISENPQTFASLIAWLFSLVSGALQFVAALSRVANWFQEHPRITAGLITALKLLIAPITFVQAQFQLWRAIVEQTTGRASSVTTGATQAMRNAFFRLAELPGKARQWFGQIVTAIVQKMGEALAFVRGIPDKIRNAFGNPGAMLQGIGRAIMAGLAGGIRSAAGQAASAAVDAVQGAIAAARRALNIGSPSKVAADAIGAPIGQGIAVGMQRTRGLVERTGRRVAGAAVPNATGAGGITVENLNVRAFGDRFSLAQIQDELALHGAA